MKNKYKIALTVIALCLSITFLFGTSYAMWKVNKVSEEEHTLVSGCFRMEYTYENAINLTNDYPMSDTDGLKKTPYTLTVQNTCNIKAKLDIVMNILNPDAGTTELDASKMKVAMSGAKTLAPTVVSTLTETTPVGRNASNAKKAYMLGSDYLNPEEKKVYKFNLWIDEEAGNEVMKQVFKSDIVIQASATKGETAVEKLTELAKINTAEMFTDDTEDANIRYMGLDPANYVDLGNGNDASGNPILWRIIGVMNNVDDGTGKKETRLKVIREQSIGDLAWDSNETNNWTTASLNTILNDSFYNRTGDYTNTGVAENMKPFIGDAVYYLGGLADSSFESAKAKDYYRIERSSSVYEGNPTTWTGKVGLMYPSDYGYATSGGNTKDKAACAIKELSNWDDSTYSDCKNNDWLYSKEKKQWTITPVSQGNWGAFYILEDGRVLYPPVVNDSFSVRTVLYLKSNVKIIGGYGTKSNPYKLGL